MAVNTQKMIGWILLGVAVISLIIGVSLPDKSPTAEYDRVGYIVCENGEPAVGEIGDGWNDCEDGSDEVQTSGAEFGGACCCLGSIGFLVLITTPNNKRQQMVIVQNPAQMQMQMQMQAQHMQMQAQQQQMRVQQQQMQMQAQQQQMQQMRQNMGNKVQQMGEKISGVGGNREKFKEILSMVLADGYMSIKEEEKIESKRVELKISIEDHRTILKELGLDFDILKKVQEAKKNEDAGRLEAAAQMYEDAGRLDKASSIRFQLKAMEKSGGGGVHTTTYNISDSAIGGGINDGKE